MRDGRRGRPSRSLSLAGFLACGFLPSRSLTTWIFSRDLRIQMVVVPLLSSPCSLLRQTLSSHAFRWSAASLSGTFGPRPGVRDRLFSNIHVTSSPLEARGRGRGTGQADLRAIVRLAPGDRKHGGAVIAVNGDLCDDSLPVQARAADGLVVRQARLNAWECVVVVMLFHALMTFTFGAARE